MTAPPRASDDHHRAEFRAWVRLHHPDRGGDPRAFADGLVAWRQRQRTRSGPPELVFFRRRPRTVSRLLRRMTGHHWSPRVR